MIPDDEMTVFSRLRRAVADAVEEEAVFAFEVTSGDPSGKASYQSFSDWADEVFAAGMSLRISPEVIARFKEEIASAFDDQDEAFEGRGVTTRSVANIEFVKPLFENHVARFGVGTIEGAAERFFSLLDYLIEANLQPPAQDYLASVARLYVWGFFGEAIVLARSALQLALDERLGEDLPQPKTKGRTRGLAPLIRAAGPTHLKRLDSAAISAANFIKTAGDAAVHRTLSSTDDEASVVIAELGRVLNQLCASARE